jgi:fructosamine-3-kinase
MNDTPTPIFATEDLFLDADSPAAAVAALFGSTTTIQRRRGVSGGSINRTEELELSNGASVFLKRNSDRYERLFEEEARGLRALRSANGPRVPQPLALFRGAGEQFLLMEYIGSTASGRDYRSELGVQLAGLHAEARSDLCGFDRDNHIGSTPQRNQRDPDWHRFFGEARLGFQMKLAVERGLADTGMARKLEQIVHRLPELLPAPDDGRPSLLHGDLWGGNVMTGPAGEPVLIDPAVYFGHREADLAMTELFGGFGRQFMEAYQATWALEPGYSRRRDLYNLYHLLNHLNLFGRSYLGSCRSIIASFS